MVFSATAIASGAVKLAEEKIRAANAACEDANLSGSEKLMFFLGF